MILGIPSTIDKTMTSDFTIGYVGGFLVRSILKSVNNCKVCKKNISEDIITNNLIRVRSYTKQSLRNPSKKLIEIIEHIFLVLSQYIPLICHEANIKKKLDLAIELNVEFIVNCGIHNLKQIIKYKTIDFFLFSYIKNVNKLLRGVNIETSNDTIQKMAIEYYRIHRTRKIKINKTKQLL